MPCTALTTNTIAAAQSQLSAQVATLQSVLSDARWDFFNRTEIIDFSRSWAPQTYSPDINWYDLSDIPNGNSLSSNLQSAASALAGLANTLRSAQTSCSGDGVRLFEDAALDERLDLLQSYAVEVNEVSEPEHSYVVYSLNLDGQSRYFNVDLCIFGGKLQCNESSTAEGFIPWILDYSGNLIDAVLGIIPGYEPARDAIAAADPTYTVIPDPYIPTIIALRDRLTFIKDWLVGFSGYLEGVDPTGTEAEPEDNCQDLINALNNLANNIEPCDLQPVIDLIVDDGNLTRETLTSNLGNETDRAIAATDACCDRLDARGVEVLERIEDTRTELLEVRADAKTLLDRAVEILDRIQDTRTELLEARNDLKTLLECPCNEPIFVEIRACCDRLAGDILNLRNDLNAIDCDLNPVLNRIDSAELAIVGSVQNAEVAVIGQVLSSETAIRAAIAALDFNCVLDCDLTPVLARIDSAHGETRARLDSQHDQTRDWVTVRSAEIVDLLNQPIDGEIQVPACDDPTADGGLVADWIANLLGAIVSQAILATIPGKLDDLVLTALIDTVTTAVASEAIALFRQLFAERYGEDQLYPYGGAGLAGLSSQVSALSGQVKYLNEQLCADFEAAQEQTEAQQRCEPVLVIPSSIREDLKLVSQLQIRWIPQGETYTSSTPTRLTHLPNPRGDLDWCLDFEPLRWHAGTGAIGRVQWASDVGTWGYFLDQGSAIATMTALAALSSQEPLKPYPRITLNHRNQTVKERVWQPLRVTIVLFDDVGNKIGVRCLQRPPEGC